MLRAFFIPVRLPVVRAGILLAALVAGQGLASPLPQGESPDGRDQIRTIHRAYAAEYEALAQKLLSRRSYGLALDALDRAAGLVDESDKAKSLRQRIVERQEALTSIEVDLSTRPPRTWTGDEGPDALKIGGAKVTAHGDRIELESQGGTARAALSTRVPERAFEVEAELRFDGKPDGGVVVDLGRQGRLSAALNGSRLVLRLTGSREDLELGARTGVPGARNGKWHRIAVRVVDRQVRVFWDGAEQIRAELESSAEGRPGIAIRGKASLKRLTAGPTATAQLVDRGRQLSRRGKRNEGALVLREAVRLDGDDLEARFELASALARAGQPRDAVLELEAFLAAADAREKPDAARDRIVARAQTELGRQSALGAEVRELGGRHIEALRELGRSLLDRDLPEAADEAFLALLALSPDDTAAENARLLAYDRRHAGDDGWIPLPLADEFEGWNVASGKPTKQDDELIAHATMDDAVELVYTSLPRAPRFQVRGSFRSEGMYELGFVLGEKEETRHRLLLRNVFRQKNVTIEKSDGSVRYRNVLGPRAPQSDRWHEFDLLVDRNRISLRVDDDPILDKVFSQPLECAPGIRVATLSKGRYRDLRVRLLANEERLREALARFEMPDLIQIEAEEAFELGQSRGGNGDNFHAHAYNGTVLGQGFGTDPGHFAEYSFDTFAMPGARLHLRYGFRGADRSLRVSLDGAAPKAVEIQEVPGRNQYRVATIELGDLAPGRHRVRITPGETPRAVDLDRLTIAGPQHRAEDFTGVVEVEDLPEFRIRVSPGVPLPLDEGELLPMLREIHTYMVDYLGYRVDRPLTLNIISRECWADPHVGGYATGGHLYVPLETVLNDIGIVIHELSHCFDFGNGHFPPWLGEGKSVPILFDLLGDTGKKYLGRVSSGRDARSKAGRTSQKRLMEGDETLIQYWGTPKLPYRGSPLRGACYDTAAYYFAELHRRYERGWLARFHALMRADLDRGSYYMPIRDWVLANSVLIDYLSRATGDDLRPMFRQFGFRLEEVYPEGAVLEADCGDDDEAHLSVSAGSKAVTFGDEGRGRTVPETSLAYAFPVRPDSPGIRLETRVQGPVEVRVGTRTVASHPNAEPATLTVDLDPSEVASSYRVSVHYHRLGETEPVVGWLRLTPSAAPRR